MSTLRIALTLTATTALTLTTTPAAVSTATEATPFAGQPGIITDDAPRELTRAEIDADPTLRVYTADYERRSFAKGYNRRANEVRVWRSDTTRTTMLATESHPESVRTQDAEIEGGQGQTFGAKWAESNPDRESLNARNYKATRQSGTVNPINIIFVAGDIRIMYHQPRENATSDQIVDGWEKNRSKTTSGMYAYTRQTVFTPGASKIAGWQINTFDPTIRMRPYKGLENRITNGPIKWAPVPYKECRNTKFQLGLGSGSSFDLPVMFCDLTVSLKFEVGHEFGAQHTTKAREQTQVTAGATWMATGPKYPAWGDYVYYDWAVCLNGMFSCIGGKDTVKQAYRWTDGW